MSGCVRLCPNSGSRKSVDTKYGSVFNSKLLDRVFFLHNWKFDGNDGSSFKQGKYRNRKFNYAKILQGKYRNRKFNYAKILI